MTRHVRRNLRSLLATLAVGAVALVGCTDGGGGDRGQVRETTTTEATTTTTTTVDDHGYPPAPDLAAKPWHPDGDRAFTMVPGHLVADSDRIIEHLAASGRFLIHTGDVEPDGAGKVGGIRLNAASPGDPTYEVVPGDNFANFGRPGTVWVHDGRYAPSSTWGAQVRIGNDAIPQGWPMRNYSDVKLHVIDPDAGTLTEVQHFERWPNGSIRAHGVTQYQLAAPSTEVAGRSAAKVPLAETTLRYEDLVLDGWVQMAHMAVPAAHATEYVAPARGTDGRSSDPYAIRMGQVLRLRADVARRLLEDPDVGPQARAVIRCYAGPGIMVVDTGGNVGTSLEPDARWDQDDLAALHQLTPDDFQVWQHVPEEAAP